MKGAEPFGKVDMRSRVLAWGTETCCQVSGFDLCKCRGQSG